jgi:alcohol dehydrogenase class IV
MGYNILIITGTSSFRSSKYWDVLFGGLDKRGINHFELEVGGEPTTDLIDEFSDYYRKRNINAIISIGGGSVIDAGKAISAMIPQKGKVAEYITGPDEKSLNGVKVPFIAVPTTAGTGSESTKNAVLTRPGKGGYKKSLRHDSLIPDIAVIDPELTLSCPPEITAACGLDALTQLLESYVSVESSFLTDALALQGIALHCGMALVNACMEKASDIFLRSNLSYAAYLSGAALANAGLGSVHGLAGAIGGSFEIPHGTICAALLEPVTALNIEKLFSAGDKKTIGKYSRAGCAISGRFAPDYKAGCSYLIEYLHDINEKLNIPGPDDFGLNKNDIDLISGQADNKNSPVKLTVDDFISILSGKRG